MVKDRHVVQVLDNMIEDIIDSFRHASERDSSRKEGSFSFIPKGTRSNATTFIELREWLVNKSQWSGYARTAGVSHFLDAGCGIGNVILTAKAAGLCRCWHGIEHLDSVYEQAVNLLRLNDRCETLACSGRDRIYVQPRNRETKVFQALKVFKGDIGTFTGYKNYDVIYYYRPFCCFDREAEFERRVEDQMKVGAILLAFYKQDYSTKRDSRFEKIPLESCPTAFIKVKD
jgi:hypothetical protein